ncbi:tetratricopeptide repeat protein [Gudongella sp. DL1XJH-153]|uniref:tetratricopeptide repeat protein n=1 Tax=Gudongella sp. DL1XJH-153 TaxID=3409804 RepID=UPI003BB49559
MSVGEKYFRDKTESVSFVQLKDERDFTIHGFDLDQSIPLPVVTEKLLSELSKVDSEQGITLERVIEGILYLMGADQHFKYHDYYSRILEAYNPDIEKELFKRAILAFENDDYTESGLFFRAYNNMYGSKEGMLYYAMVLEAMGKKRIEEEKIDEGNEFLEESTAILEELLDEDREYYPAYYKLGYHYKFYEQYVKAKLTWDKVLIYDPDENRRQEIRQELDLIDSDYRVELGLTYMNNMNYEKSIEVLSKLMPKHSKNWYANYLLGMAYRGYGDNQMAMDYFYAAMDSDPTVAEVYNELGISYFNDNDIEKAIDIFTEGIEAGIHDDYRLFFNRGLGYLNLGEIDKGYDDVYKAHKLDPEDENVKAQLNAIDRFKKEQ